MFFYRPVYVWRFVFFFVFHHPSSNVPMSDPYQHGLPSGQLRMYRPLGNCIVPQILGGRSLFWSYPDPQSITKLWSSNYLRKLELRWIHISSYIHHMTCREKEKHHTGVSLPAIWGPLALAGGDFATGRQGFQSGSIHWKSDKCINLRKKKKKLPKSLTIQCLSETRIRSIDRFALAVFPPWHHGESRR
jgi:hypothetical protein